MYISNFFGLDLEFKSNLHLYSPYSKQLTKDFDDIDISNTVAMDAPPALRKDEFMSTLGNKDSKWLEIATTIIHQMKIDPNFSLEHLDDLKDEYDSKFIDGGL